MKKIIAISGHAQSGKDTTAMIIEQCLKKDGYSVLITHFAGLLKYICKEFFGWNGEKDEYGRSLLQYVGTNVFRSNDPDYWVSFIERILMILPDKWDYVIIPDARFPNEISYFKDLWYNVIHLKIVRDNYDDKMNELQRSHESETSMDTVKPDYIIENNGDYSELEEKISKWIKENLYEQ